MNSILLLAAVSAFTLSAECASAGEGPARAFVGKVRSSAIPKGAKLLYNQNSNATGVSVNSQNFTSGSFSSYDDQSADDFVVPKNSVWTVTEVDVSGVYFNGSGPASSENVIFYADRRGEPGNAVKHGAFTNLKGTDQDGDFAIKLSGRALRLAPGAYWVSVVANCSYESGCGEWGWDTNSLIHGYPAMWRNASFGSACPSWGTLEDCLGYSGDLMFELRGIAKRKRALK